MSLGIVLLNASAHLHVHRQLPLTSAALPTVRTAHFKLADLVVLY
jgi:hypothetical protein